MPHDVVICGGGLAGLTLALQVRRRCPSASVVVIERVRRPLPEACHKVGESTVEIGGRYLGKILGFHDYLRSEHFIKNGLRFFAGHPSSPIAERSEMGPRESPTVPAYQLDRGRLENDLRARCEEEGIELREGWGVRDVTLGEPHVVEVVQTRSDAPPEKLEARWVIDATGRRRLLAKKLGLHRDIPRQASSAWFRVGERVKIDQMVPEGEAGWHDRDIDKNRWLSTVHLCGTGYWIWMIALKTGHTSIGLVAENADHAFTDYSTEASIRAWLREHEPALAARLEGVELEDFVAMKDYRYDATRVLSKDRWALVGESGLFIDPMYSPGTDLIALANCFTTELVADDLGGALDPERVDALDAFYRDWATLLARTMVLGSRVFGAPEVLGAKLHWDFFYYWAFMCPYFFAGTWTLPAKEHERFHAMLHRFTELNERAQRTLQAWAELAPSDPTLPFVGLPAIATTLSDLHLALKMDRSADETYAAMESTVAWGEELVVELMLRGLRRAGPERAAEYVRAIGVDWSLPETRFDADEATPRDRRKLLGKAIRDMERSIGKNAADGGPTLRELWQVARR
ncbi:MAG: NAD(P)/FAD-dependent oxidoreductase [Sandaracinaceae bacterium]|nr:NAD(P)/FAD-dependent oxidoreductase [Sandaracinaceae bacterium]